MTAADIYRSHVFCNAYCTSFFEKTIDKSASFDIIDSVPNELNIWGYSSAGRALEWHSRGQRFDPAYLHHEKQQLFNNGLRNNEPNQYGLIAQPVRAHA